MFLLFFFARRPDSRTSPVIRLHCAPSLVDAANKRKIASAKERAYKRSGRIPIAYECI
jgi:hypothetical protein